jgi:hypothetical protein
MNDTHELLFLIANEFLELNFVQKLNVGLKLNLIDFKGFCRTEKAIEEMVFVRAYKKGIMSQLVKEIEKMKHATKKPE